MFVMASPLEAHLSETLTSLKFATKVCSIALWVVLILTMSRSTIRTSAQPRRQSRGRRDARRLNIEVCRYGLRWRLRFPASTYKMWHSAERNTVGMGGVSFCSRQDSRLLYIN